MRQQETGIPRLIAATGHSIRGLRACWKHEEAFRLDVLLLIIGLPLSFLVARNAIQWLLLILPLCLLMIVELLNSAVEAAIDRIGTEHHTLSGRAKDTASAAVFMCLCLIGLCWGVIIYSNFL